MNKLEEDGWRKIKLTVGGQQVFWDDQSSTYETEEMTTDNQGEVDATLESCREIDCKDIVTLGGAVGCRDPKMILEDMFSHPNGNKPEVIFNDLSSCQTERAKTSILKPFINKGVKITFLPGEISNICRHIASKPRRLILGVYNCMSFFKAEPESGYPFCGYDEYLRNSRIIGEDFLFDWVIFSQTNELVSIGLRARISIEDDIPTRNTVREALAAIEKEVSSGALPLISALQIISQHRNKAGFFLSHWYTQNGILSLVRSVFADSDFTITIKHFPKGMALIIDPIGAQLQGVVTVLNNVIGNVLPQSQYETLHAIREIIS